MSVFSTHRIATFVAGSGLFWASIAIAQGPAGGQPSGGAAQTSTKHGTSVAVVDIKFIFDNHQGFKVAMDSIKKDYDTFEASVRETEGVLRKKLEELKAGTPGSEQFKQLEEQIAQTRTQVQLDISRKQKQRVEEEAKVYHRAYQDIEKQIEKFADRYGIDLVLQFSSAEIDPGKPDTVIRGLNRLVVYQRSLNITKYVLDELNRQGGVTPPPAVTGGGGNGATGLNGVNRGPGPNPQPPPRNATPGPAPGTFRK